MHKHLSFLMLPTIMGMATLLPSDAIHAAEPQSAIGHLEERLQQTQNMQNELTRQLQDSRRMQEELTEQRRQLEDRLVSQQKQASDAIAVLRLELEGKLDAQQRQFATVRMQWEVWAL